MDRLQGFLDRHGALSARLASLGLAVGIGLVFVLSSLLVPAEEGHGTHTQLGLGDCSFLSVTGQPCPMCGATTSFTLMANLRPVEAFVNQPFAVLLSLLSAFGFAVAVSEVIDPRGRWGTLSRWLEPRETWLALGFLTLMGLGWGYKIWRMG